MDDTDSKGIDQSGVLAPGSVDKVSTQQETGQQPNSQFQAPVSVSSSAANRAAGDEPFLKGTTTVSSPGRTNWKLSKQDWYKIFTAIQNDTSLIWKPQRLFSILREIGVTPPAGYTEGAWRSKWDNKKKSLIRVAQSYADTIEDGGECWAGGSGSGSAAWKFALNEMEPLRKFAKSQVDPKLSFLVAQHCWVGQDRLAQEKAANSPRRDVVAAKTAVGDQFPEDDYSRPGKPSNKARQDLHSMISDEEELVPKKTKESIDRYLKRVMYASEEILRAEREKREASMRRLISDPMDHSDDGGSDQESFGGDENNNSHAQIARHSNSRDARRKVPSNKRTWVARDTDSRDEISRDYRTRRVSDFDDVAYTGSKRKMRKIESSDESDYEDEIDDRRARSARNASSSRRRRPTMDDREILPATSSFSGRTVTDARLDKVSQQLSELQQSVNEILSLLTRWIRG